MLRLELRLLEAVLHRGHDGFLRGHPEPLLLWAAYRLGAEPQLLGKARHGLEVAGPFPFKRSLDALLFKIKRVDEEAALALLCVAFEADSGEDVAAVFAELEDAAALTLRAADSPIAAPFSLAELALAHFADPPGGQLVALAHRGCAVAERCVRDDWIGAALVVLQPRKRLACRWTPRLRSANGRNDWELELALRLF